MELTERVVTAAEAALADHHYASFIDVLTGMRLLHNVEAWHNGRVQYLDEMVQGSPDKLSRVIATFRKWAEQRGLRAEDLPPHDANNRKPPKYHVASQIPEMEKIFRQYFVSPSLSESKLRKLREKVGSAPPPTVFYIVRESACSHCKQELWEGDLLTMQGNQPLCMECADLDHLVFLARGDTALTRRATKHSRLWAVVVRFSRSRNRYERQGVLVQPDALEKAEEECLADADLRAARQSREAERRKEEDVELVGRMTEKIRALYPRCPPAEARRIAAHTAARGSGRVGRSAAGRGLEDDALGLAVAAWVRHNHTRYDELLMQGVERDDARSKIREDVDDVLDRWEIA